jgi:hypothetical protein
MEKSIHFFAQVAGSIVSDFFLAPDACYEKF